MRRYELMLLFRPDLEDDKLQSAVERVTRAIVNAGGALTKVSPWGKRRLAYQIQHFREASYFLIHFDIAPSAVREIERGLLISEEILRHMVTVLEDHGPGDESELEPAAPARAAAAPALEPADEAAEEPRAVSEPAPVDEPEAVEPEASAEGQAAGEGEADDAAEAVEAPETVEA